MNSWMSPGERATPADRAAYQIAALSELYTRAVKTSAFYADLVGRDSIESLEDYFDAVAPTTKSDLLADASANSPYGSILAVPRESLARVFIHPGPQVIAWTASERERVLDMWAHGIRTVGFDEADLVDVTFQYSWVLAGTVWEAAVGRAGAAVAPGGAGGTAEHIENLRSLRFTGLMGFPTYLEEIAARALELGIDPAKELSVRKILVVGEQRGQDAKERLRQAFGADFVREAYGTAEAGLVAAECGESDGGMHVHHDVVLEVRDPETGELVPEGEGGELYVTPLWREAMPLLRFRTGDITEYVRLDTCPCGRTSPRIGRILGRTSDLVRVKGTFLSLATVNDIITDGGSSPTDFVMTVTRPERRDHIALQVVIDDDVDENELLAGLASRFKQRCRVAVVIEAVPPGTLPAGSRALVDHR